MQTENLFFNILIDLHAGFYKIVSFHERLLTELVYNSIYWKYLEGLVAEHRFIDMSI